jgi:hypothetical protein
VAAPSSLSRFHVPSSPPFEVNPEDRLVSIVANVYLPSWKLQATATSFGTLGMIAQVLVIYDALPWGACFAGIFQILPAACVVSCLNKPIMRELGGNFQTVFLGGSSLLMFCCFCVLWRNHPSKAVSLALTLPMVTLAGFTDAYPEGGRILLSRVFMAIFIAWVVVLHVGVTTSLIKIDDMTISAYEGSLWSIKLSTVVSGSLSTMAMFGVKNLLSTAAFPGSLAVLKSQVSLDS